MYTERTRHLSTHTFFCISAFFLFPLLDNQCVVRKLNVYDYGIRWTTQCDFSYLAIEELLVYLNVSNVNSKTNVKKYSFLIYLLYVYTENFFIMSYQLVG